MQGGANQGGAKVCRGDADHICPQRLLLWQIVAAEIQDDVSHWHCYETTSLRHHSVQTTCLVGIAMRLIVSGITAWSYGALWTHDCLHSYSWSLVFVLRIIDRMACCVPSVLSMERLFHPLVRSRKNLGCDELACFPRISQKGWRANRSWQIMQHPASGGTLATALLRQRVRGTRWTSGMGDGMDDAE